MLLNKKGIGPVIASALLILVAVAGVVSFQTWFADFSSGTFANVETQSSDKVSATGIDNVIANVVYFRNSGSKNVTISSLKIDGKVCTTSQVNATPGNTLALDVTGCMTDGLFTKREVVVFTSDKIYSEYYQILGADNLTTSISFVSGECSVATGFVNIFGLSGLSNAHAESSTQTDFSYNLCAKHGTYTLGNSCSGNYQRLFYLGNVSSSHIWIDNSTAYTPYAGYYTWTPVCVSSSAGTLDLQYNSTDLSGSGYECLGSYIQNDTYGGVVGNCVAHSDKIWLKIT